MTKYDASGVKQFTKQMGAPSAITTGLSVTTDSNGNFYIAGITTGGLDGNTLTGTMDFFVTKYNSSGVKQFTKQMGAPSGSTEGRGVAADIDGNFYVAGVTDRGLDGNVAMGIVDTFVTKYNSTGIKQFTKQVGVASKTVYGITIATDTNQNFYIAGNTNTGLDGNTLAGNLDMFVFKFDANGVKQ